MIAVNAIGSAGRDKKPPRLPAAAFFVTVLSAAVAAERAPEAVIANPAFSVQRAGGDAGDNKQGEER